MPLYIKDPEVDRLIGELTKLTKATKVDVVRAALQSEIKQHKRAQPLRDRLGEALAAARAAGPFARGDHKHETDQMWGET